MKSNPYYHSIRKLHTDFPEEGMSNLGGGGID